MSAIMENEGRGRIKAERLRESVRAERMNEDMSFRFHTKTMDSILFFSSTTTRSVELVVYSDLINQDD